MRPNYFIVIGHLKRGGGGGSSEPPLDPQIFCAYAISTEISCAGSNNYNVFSQGNYSFKSVQTLTKTFKKDIYLRKRRPKSVISGVPNQQRAYAVFVVRLSII